MKISNSKIDSFLKKPSQDISLFLFYGPDYGLSSERCSLLIKLMGFDLEDPFTSFFIKESDIEQDPIIIMDEVLTIPLFQKKKLIRIRLININFTQKLTKIIKELISLLPFANTYVFIDCGDIKSSSEIINKVSNSSFAISIPSYHDENIKIGQMAKTMFSKEGIAIGSDEISALSNLLGDDHLNSKNEIDKLISYIYPKQTVSISDIEICLSFSNLIEIEKIVFSVVNGDFFNFINLFDHSINSGTDVFVIIKVAQKVFNNLLTASIIKDQGFSVDDALKKSTPGLFWKTKPLMLNGLKLWKTKNIEKTISHLLDLEERVKIFPNNGPTFASHSFLSLSTWIKKETDSL